MEEIEKNKKDTSSLTTEALLKLLEEQRSREAIKKALTKGSALGRLKGIEFPDNTPPSFLERLRRKKRPMISGEKVGPQLAKIENDRIESLRTALPEMRLIFKHLVDADEAYREHIREEFRKPATTPLFRIINKLGAEHASDAEKKTINEGLEDVRHIAEEGAILRSVRKTKGMEHKIYQALFQLNMEYLGFKEFLYLVDESLKDKMVGNAETQKELITKLQTEMPDLIAKLKTTTENIYKCAEDMQKQPDVKIRGSLQTLLKKMNALDTNIALNKHMPDSLFQAGLEHATPDSFDLREFFKRTEHIPKEQNSGDKSRV